MTTSVLILHVPGTNRDGDMAEACALAGGRVSTKTLSDIVHTPAQILSYDFLVFPGGFSFGDDLGAVEDTRISSGHTRHGVRGAVSHR